jgi:hypothetical protein
VALANCVEKTPRCPRYVRLMLMLYISFDICNDTGMGLMSSLAGHEGPKFDFVKVFISNDFAPWWGKRCFFVINQAMKMSCR